MNRIGIIGHWHWPNYGGCISYYSLYRAIKKLGYEPIFIEDPRYDKGWDTLFTRRFFREEDARIGKAYSDHELDKLKDVADAFVLGSDQTLTTAEMRDRLDFLLMTFADSSKNRIIISASTRDDTFDSNDYPYERVKEALNKFDRFWIRENKGTQIIRDRFHIAAEQMVDPVFLTSKEEYFQLAEGLSTLDKEGLKLPNEYVLGYILDPNEDKCRGLNIVSDILKCSKRIILDGNNYEGRWGKKYENMEEYKNETFDILQEREWLYCFAHAKYIVTDSFHGACMALIFNKPLYTFVNRGRGYERFRTLEDIFDIRDYMVESAYEIDTHKILHSIDYKKVNSIIESKKSSAIKKIASVLSEEHKEGKLTLKGVDPIVDIKDCVGCV